MDLDNQELKETKIRNNSKKDLEEEINQKWINKILKSIDDLKKIEKSDYPEINEKAHYARICFEYLLENDF